MKLEVGMYVRTDKGIAKIENYNYHEELPNNPFDFNKYHIYKQDIIKSSNSIIDLIEVGDYVNGKLIHSIQRTNDNAKLLEYGNGNHIKDIKSILTHEQYENNTYKVVE